jgi:predicted amidohydrolase
VRIVGQKIDLIAEDIPAAPGDIVEDISGRILSPGLIDMHVHAYLHGHLLSLDVDTVAPTSGTTTFVDAGTRGILQFPVTCSSEMSAF